MIKQLLNKETSDIIAAFAVVAFTFCSMFLTIVGLILHKE